MTASIQSVCEQLERWRPGHRAWFWLCPSLDNTAPILLIRSLTADANMDKLCADVAGMGSVDGPSFVGLASADEQGRLSFGGPGLSRRELGRLSEWVKHNVDDHPALARLKNAEFVHIDGDGVIAARAVEPALWQGVPDVAVSGTLSVYAQRLQKLKVGMNFWYWMTDSGPGKKPFLFVAQQRKDPSGERFAEQVGLLCRRSSALGQTHKGVLRQTDDGALLFSSQASSSRGVSILQSLIDAHPAEFAVLNGASVVRTSSGKFVDQQTVAAETGPDLSRQSQLLEALDGDAPVFFWLTDAADSGAPMLVLETNKDALKAGAQAVGGKGNTLRGQLKRHKTGWIELRSSKTMPDVIAVLARFVHAHRSAWPVLDQLKGARMTQRDRAGEIISRQRNDAVWER